GAADPDDGAEAPRDAQPARRDPVHLPGLLPGDDELPVLAVDPARPVHGRLRMDLRGDARGLQPRGTLAHRGRAPAPCRLAARPGDAADGRLLHPLPTRDGTALGPAAGFPC